MRETLEFSFCLAIWQIEQSTISHRKTSQSGGHTFSATGRNSLTSALPMEADGCGDIIQELENWHLTGMSCQVHRIQY